MKQHIVKNDKALKEALLGLGTIAPSQATEMIAGISHDMRKSGEIFLWDGDGGFITITNHVLAEKRRKKNGKHRK